MAKDLFSKQAEVYAKYRPTYPKELIEYILSFIVNKEIAWDCATGNGQAALLLAPYFQKIFATDISEKQVSQATPHPAVIYSISSAEQTSFDDNKFDLITVGQAYHWFRFDSFFHEATRVGKPNATVAVWGYGLITATDEKLDKSIRHFYTDVTGKYWDPERRYVDEKYKTVPFAFRELPSKDFKIDVKWKIEDFTGYLNTWSSVQHFITANHYNPIDEFARDLNLIWKDDIKRSFSFPLFLRVGRIEK